MACCVVERQLNLNSPDLEVDDGDDYDDKDLRFL
jgi:hypothetical protein